MELTLNISAIVAIIGVLLWSNRKVDITLNGEAMSIRVGSTCEEVIQTAELSPKAGNLVSVSGKRLQEGAGYAYTAKLGGNELSEDDLVRILTEPKNALVKQYQKLLEYDMVELDFDTQALEAAADRAIERGIGARGLRAVLEEVMTPLMYEVPSDPTITRVTITAESVKEHVSPAVEHDPDRTQRPLLGGAALHAEQGGVSPKGNVS